VKVTAVADRAFSIFTLRRALGNWQFEGVFALLTLVLPLVTLKYIPARTKWCPGRCYHHVRASARWAVYLEVVQIRIIGYFQVEDVPALLA